MKSGIRTRRHESFRWVARGALAGINVLSLLLAGCASTPAGMPIDAGTTVHAVGDEFSLRPANDDWNRFPVTEAETPERSVLVLATRDDTAALTAYTRYDATANLDGVVADRRAAILEAGGYGFRERRSFLGDRDEMTISLSRYEQYGSVLLVLTTIRAPLVVELIGTTARGFGSERALIEVMESIRLRAREENP